TIDVVIFRGAQIVGEIQWGKIPERAQYILFLLATSFTWLMGLMGYARSGLRTHWHVFNAVRDYSSDAFTPPLGFACWVILAIVGFFLYVRNSIPQLSQPPPQDLVLAADASVEDFVRAGYDIFYGKGTCALCHEIGKKGERCPDLAGVGARAETRIKEEGYKGRATNGAEYIVESLHEPTIYVVEGYQPSMPPLGRQLSDLELIAVLSFLQS